MTVSVPALKVRDSINQITSFQTTRHQASALSVSSMAQQAINESFNFDGGNAVRALENGDIQKHDLAQVDINDTASIAKATGMNPRHLGFAQAMANDDPAGALNATGLDRRELHAVASLANGDYMGALATVGVDPRVASAGQALMSGDYLGALAAAGLDPRIAGAGKALMSGDYLGVLAAAGVDPRAVGAAKAMIGGDPLSALAAATGVDPQTLSMAKSLMKGDVLGALSDKTGIPLDRAAKFLKSPASAAKSAVSGNAGLGGGGAAKNTDATKKKDKSGVNIPMGDGGGKAKDKSKGATKGPGADGDVSDGEASDSVDEEGLDADDKKIAEEDLDSCSCAVTDESGFNDAGDAVPSTAGTETRCCPISVVSGEELLEHVDFSVGTIIPFQWVRTYRSSGKGNKGLGYGWSCSLSETISIEDRKIILKDCEGRNIPFPFIAAGETCENTAEKQILHREANDTLLLWSALTPTAPYKRFVLDQSSECFWLDSIEDLHGNAWQCFYEEGRVQSLQSSWGEGLSFAYENTLLQEISRYTFIKKQDEVVVNVGSTQMLVKYQYDAEQDLVAAIDASGHCERYAFIDHIIVQRTLKTGYNYYFEWDRHDNKGKCLRNWGDSVQGVATYDYHFKYDPENRCTRVTDTRGGIETFYYNERGQVERVIDPLGHQTQTIYDHLGNVTEKIGPCAERTHFSYDELQRPENVTDEMGDTTYVRYNALGKVETLTDAQGLDTLQQYDDKGMLTSVITPSGNVHYFSYNEQGLLTEQRQEGAPGVSYQWSAFGQLTKKQQGSLYTHYEYDVMGRLIKVRDEREQCTHYTYDANNQIKSITDPQDQTRYYDYNPDGLLTCFTNPEGQTLQYEYAGLNQPIKRIDPNGDVLRYEYDGEQNLIALHNENGDTYRFEYDLNENVIRETTFDGRVKLHEYNASAHLTKTREFTQGQLEPVHDIEFRRDRQGRLLEQYNSDEDYIIFTYQHNRLASADNGKRALKFEYDLLGRLITEQQGDHRIHYQYDPQDRRKAIQLPDGRVLAYHYGDFKTTITLDDKKLVEANYNAQGQETHRQCGELLDIKNYDEAGRLVEHKVSAQQHKQCLVHRQYQYDPSNGLLRNISDQQRGLTQYHFDAKQQLTQTEGQYPESFIYDPAGNLLKENSVIDANRLSLQGDKHFDYDHQGNRIEERWGKHGALRTRYTYNAFNQLIKVEKRNVDKVTQLVTYEYDAFGRRINKTDAFGKTEFLWRGDQLLSEQRDSIHKVFLYEWDSFVPFALLQDNNIYYYQNDHLGTPQELLDQHGKTVWSAHYKTWGRIAKVHVQVVDNPLRFQGQYYDEETGLHYNRHRYYDPSLGRFVTQDPIGLAGGVNGYRYVPNPVGWVDPLGLQCKTCFSMSHSDKASLERYGRIREPQIRAHEKVFGKGRGGKYGEYVDTAEFLAGGAFQTLKDTGGFATEHTLDTVSLLTGDLSISPGVPTFGQRARQWVEGLGRSSTPSPFNAGQNDRELGLGISVATIFRPSIGLSTVDKSRYIYTTKDKFTFSRSNNPQYKDKRKARTTPPIIVNSTKVPVVHVEKKSGLTLDAKAPNVAENAGVGVVQEATKSAPAPKSNNKNDDGAG